MTSEYVCVYCGTVKTSHNGTGGDVACCGEVGHVEPMPEMADDHLRMPLIVADPDHVPTPQECE